MPCKNSCTQIRSDLPGNRENPAPFLKAWGAWTTSCSPQTCPPSRQHPRLPPVLAAPRLLTAASLSPLSHLAAPPFPFSARRSLTLLNSQVHSQECYQHAPQASPSESLSPRVGNRETSRARTECVPTGETRTGKWNQLTDHIRPHASHTTVLTHKSRESVLTIWMPQACQPCRHLPWTLQDPGSQPRTGRQEAPISEASPRLSAPLCSIYPPVPVKGWWWLRGQWGWVFELHVGLCSKFPTI